MKNMRKERNRRERERERERESAEILYIRRSLSASMEWKERKNEKYEKRKK